MSHAKFAKCWCGLARKPASGKFYRAKPVSEKSKAIRAAWRATAGKYIWKTGGKHMEETKVALIGIVVENEDSIGKLNIILHNYGQYIIGRMGIPYQKRNISIISVAIDAPADVISALSGKLGMLPGISAKTVYSKLPQTGENL